MKEASLQELKKQGAIMGYEVLAVDHEKNVIDVNIQFFPALNKVTFSKRLADAWKRVKGRSERLTV